MNLCLNTQGYHYSNCHVTIPLMACYDIPVMQRLIHTFIPEQNGHHFADSIFKYIPLNENIDVLIEISLNWYYSCMIGLALNWYKYVNKITISVHKCSSFTQTTALFMAPQVLWMNWLIQRGSLINACMVPKWQIQMHMNCWLEGGLPYIVLWCFAGCNQYITHIFHVFPSLSSCHCLSILITKYVPIFTQSEFEMLTFLLPGHCLVLTHCGLVTPYGDKDLGQHWFR